MRSRAESRRGAEWLLRVALVALLAVALWRSLHPAAPASRARAAHAGTLGSALREATESAAIGELTVDATSPPTPAQRDWLRALRAAGVRVRWHGRVPSLALAAQGVREPAAGTRILLAADSGATALFRDSAGALDSLVMLRGGASLESELVGAVTARVGHAVASIPVPPAGERRAVLVLGRAGWESRFVVAALGEAGWTVRARLPVAPGVAVADAGVLPIDSARYDVVVALDSSAADLAPAVARFVGAGGGLVAVGAAMTLASFRPLVPARAAARTPGRILLEGELVTLADLPLRALGSLRADAVVLERRNAGPVTAAVRRAGMGRVATVGYDDSWRWRMQGGAGGLAAHRAWWSRMVGLVAPERVVAMPGAAAPLSDPAPLAALVSALGPPSDSSSTRGLRAASPRGMLPLALLLLIATALLAETASRRFRGAR